MDNRRLLVAALLSMAVLFLWQVLFPPPEPPRRPVAPAAEAAASEPAAQPTPGLAPEASASESPAPPTEAAATEPAAETPLAASEEERVVLENDRLRAEFSNRGAQLVSLQLKSRLDRDGEPLELIQRRGATPYPFALVDGANAPRLVDALFTVEREDGAEPSARFVYRDADGSASKRFRLSDAGLLEFEIASPGAAAGWGVLLGPGVRNATKEELGSRFNVRAAVWKSQDKVEILAAGKAEESTTLPGGTVDWAGLEDTYFLTAAIPDQRFGAVRIEPVRLVGANGNGGRVDAQPVVAGAELSPEEKKLPVDLRLVLVAGADGRVAGTSYWGAKQYDRLASFPWGLEKTVRFGFFGFLAKPLLRALQWIHAHLTPNYGWAIVLLTIALKTVLLPLSLAGFKSMRKMQKLAPKMQAIRERYRPKLRDKQGRFNADMQRQMNEEIMGLYRTEGVNPAGGCLPMLIQLPIFFAFYQLLSTAVELWRSPWAFWIHDLTAPDPYWALPIIMGISQLAQTKMTPPPPDPVQRRLMQALPIVFTVFSLGFPSGLVLYWLTNNVLSIAQQGLYNRIRTRAEEQEQEAADAAKAARKRSRKGS